MMSAKNPKLQQYIERARQATFDRRSLVWKSALGGSAAAAAFATRRGWVSAQDSAGGAIHISREEYAAKLNETYPINPDAPQGGVIILGDSSDINNTNGILMDNSPTIDIMGLVFENLVTPSAVGPEYVPGLADSWEVSEDGLTWTFHLHEGISWHDGQPFTADDVIFSFEAQASPDTGSSYTGSFNDMVASFAKVDDLTVTLTANDLFAPVVFIENSVGSTPILPKHVWEGVAFADWAADPGSTGQDPARVIGTGPFTFVEWVQGETTRLARNEGYWDQTSVPNIDELIFQVWPDEATEIEALRAGDTDLYERLPPAEYEAIGAEDHLDTIIHDTYSFTFYAYNLDPEKTTLFQDVEVRQALFYALDRQSLVDNVWVGLAEVAQGTQPVLSIAYAPDQIETQYNYDPAKAQELLESAGWVDSDGDGVREKDGQKLAFEVMYTGGIAIYDQIVPYMQEAWAEIGVEMTPNPVDFGSVLLPAVTENFNYDIAMLGFSWSISGDQSAMFHSEFYVTGFNLMRYSNPEVDRLIDEANRELDPERRVQLLIESQNLVNNDLPAGILVFRKDPHGFNVRVKNWNPNSYGSPDLTWSLPYVWIEE
jgi:peptide/nickel transport system substrate-binding protein